MRTGPGGAYFGRTLDLDRSYGERLFLAQGRFPLKFQTMGTLFHHHPILGMAVTAEGLPLYYDATNNWGLSMAGLNFPGNARYLPVEPEKDNVSAFELIPWVLGQCATVAEARQLLQRVNLANLPLREDIPLAPLHWLIADSSGAIVAEPMKQGLRIYDNPTGVLTNNPPFPYQLFQLNNYRGLSPQTPESTFSPEAELRVYSQGLGGLGLPGDASSMSRFVRMAFHAGNAAWSDDTALDMQQVFHLLDSVAMVKGCCKTESGTDDYTVYSACLHKGCYAYTTWENRKIQAIRMEEEDLEGENLLEFPLFREPSVANQRKNHV